MEQKPKISIIVPAYNVDKYIAQCLDSLVNQTYDNIEIILINDFSIDDTGRIFIKTGLYAHNLTIGKLMDEIRIQIGVVFPCER